MTSAHEDDYIPKGLAGLEISLRRAGPRVASSVHLGSDSQQHFFSFVDAETGIYTSVNINLDQLVLLLKQSAEEVSRLHVERRRL